MAGLDGRRLALLQSTHSGSNERASYSIGTGYFLTGDIVLTASHVVPSDGVSKLEVRTEADGVWRSAEPVALWRDTLLDAVLIRVLDPLGEVPDVSWVEDAFTDDLPWQSSGYPVAAKVEHEGKPARKTVGLDGKLHAQGGGGQGPRELDLTVEAPPKADHWPGVSGAPVFVGDKLAGFIKDAPESFQGGRLVGVPSTSLLQDHAFRIAVSAPWLERLPDRPWVLVVLSELNKSDLGEWVDGSLQKHHDALKSVVGEGLVPTSIKVKITEAFQSPGRWLRFVKALCAAPIAIFDATGLEPQPAVMLALGVRSVVRRGVTITSTADAITEEYLSQLPFNIQETKLIHHGSSLNPKDDRHPHNMIATAIKEGWRELQSQPRYLDLPAYDGVRGPVPAAYAGNVSALERILVLCPFHPDYGATNWLHIANAIALHYPVLPPPARMLDIASPRLVGQTLYESIRWAKTCIADWTRWRANMFFEFGVRIACADIGSVCLIERSALEDAVAANGLEQKRMLLALFRPTTYDVSAPSDQIRVALKAHDAISRQFRPPVPASALPQDATYKTCEDAFDWAQERITVEPHEALRQSVEAPFGKDRQAVGRPPVLFSANPSFRKELERSVQERWIAAWYYLQHRYPKDRWREDAALRAALRKLGNDVLQFGIRGATDEHLKVLGEEIFDVIDELDELDKDVTKGSKNANADRTDS